MALELIAAPVLEVLCDRLSSLISSEYHLLSGFNKDLEKLSKTLFTIQTVLEDAETKQIKDKRTKDWLSGLKDAAYDAEDVLDELEYEALEHESKVGGHICTKQNRIECHPRMSAAAIAIISNLSRISHLELYITELISICKRHVMV